MSYDSQHVPVLLDEVIEGLALPTAATVVDGTLGGGGYTRRLAEVVGPDGVVLSVDRDPAAIERGEQELRGLPVKLAHANFCDVPEILDELTIKAVDGMVLDLGLSSDQLASRERGFSFSEGGELDMRFDTTAGEPAWRLINRLSAEHLADVIYQYGEERYSRRIANRIVEVRRDHPIRDAAELAELVRRAIPSQRGRDRIDPATRTFQALRIAVNDELKSLDIALERLPNWLRPGGRIAIVSFHSLEDRRVKEAFRDDPRLENLTRRPIVATDQEIARNPRSRSAKLRIAARR